MKIPRITRLCYNDDMGRKVRGGFTLVELALSLVFIGILSVTVVLMIQSVVSSYRRGQVLNQVNTVGMDLIDDFQSSIQNSDSDSVVKLCDLYYSQDTMNLDNCVKDNASRFVSVIKYGSVSSGGKTISSMPLFGAFCTGKYTYLWNSGYTEDINRYDSNVAYLLTEPYTKGFWFRLLKVYDDGRSVCVRSLQNVAKGIYGNANYYVSSKVWSQSEINSYVSNVFVVDGAMIKNESDAVELLPQNKMANLALYDLYINQPALNATRNNMLYSGTFILGTARGGINLKSTGTCQPPSQNYSDLEYCAINNFNFAIMAGGGN